MLVKCEECIHFTKDEETKDQGFCLRYPRIFALHEGEMKWLYPSQFTYDKCGEFKKIK